MKTAKILKCYFSFSIQLLILLTIGGNGFAQRAVYLTAENAGLKKITAQQLLAHVTYLSSAQLQGRLVGSPSYDLACDNVRTQFARLGLQPLGDEQYDQHFQLETNLITAPMRFSLVTPNGEKIAFQPGTDFVARGFSGSGTVQAPVVFCGYGLSFPDQNYDDYAGVDVRGKEVLVFKQPPSWSLPGAANIVTASWPRAKAQTVAGHGAVGLMMVSVPNVPNVQGVIGSVLDGPGSQLLDFPQIHISQEATAQVLAHCGYSLPQLQAAIDSTRKPLSLELKSVVELEIHADYDSADVTQNVVGLLPGSDAKLKNEYIVVGAHLDHVGWQGGEVLFPGANDNASGSAALIQLAEALTANPIKVKRSVIFIAFAAEESGLKGATYFVNHPPVPLTQIVAMVNMDCIGVGDSIQVGGGKSYPGLYRLAMTANSLVGNLLTTQTWAGGGADAGPFFDQGVATLYFVTTNSYRYLHLPTDRVETLNANLFQAIARLAYLTVWQLANQDHLDLSRVTPDK